METRRAGITEAMASRYAPKALMRVIAVIDDPGVVENILRHLGAWHDPPASPAPPGASEPHTYEPCDKVDPPRITKTS